MRRREASRRHCSCSFKLFTYSAGIPQVFTSFYGNSNLTYSVCAVAPLTLCRYTFVVGNRLPEEVERLGVLLVGYPHAVPVGPAEAALLPAALATFQLYRNVSPSLTHNGVGAVLQ
jgi:hypothetical protein